MVIASFQWQPAAAQTCACPGDVGGNLQIDAGDLGELLAAWGQPDPLLDLNGDGLVEAADLGLLLQSWGPCTIPCGGSEAGDCCLPHAGGACAGASCNLAVCEAAPSCCLYGWDLLCATIATVMPECPCTFESVCGSGGECGIVHDTPGCGDPACCAAVCEFTPFCCQVAWDQICVLSATTVCAVTGCGTSKGACDSEHRGPGCADEECCALVCNAEEFCCTVAWDALCVETALLFCAANPACAQTPPTVQILTAAEQMGVFVKGACDAENPKPTIDHAKKLVAWGGLVDPVPGVLPETSKVRLVLKDQPDACCRLVRTGFVQNLLGSINKFEYSGGGTVEMVKPVEGDCKLPLLDIDPALKPPWYSSTSGKKKDQEFEVTMEDSPAGAIASTHAKQTLTKVTSIDTFRTWLVTEFPTGSGLYSYHYFWDWKVEHEFKLKLDAATGKIVLDGPPKNCATVTAHQAWTGGNPQPKLEGPSANGCARRDKVNVAGFGP
jgi:hypothetical protein